MREHEELQEQVKWFVAEYLRVKPERLLLTTRIGHDLGVDGDDGMEFMQAFAERFAVDLSCFEFDRHFGPEAGCNPVVCIFLWLFDRDQLKLAPITIERLSEAARTKQWQAPEQV